MKFDHLTTLMPCRSLEELSLRRDADEAEQLLAAWSALWHPALVAAAGAMPRWAAAESPPAEPAEHLVLLPPCCEGLLPDGWLAQAEAAGAVVLRGHRHRPEMIAAALERLEPAPPPVDADLVADFLALGFCHFTIELLTQHLRYMSNLDEASFERELLAAARAAFVVHASAGSGVASPASADPGFVVPASAGSAPPDDRLKAALQNDAAPRNEAARGHLQAAFDLLHTAREYFYPVEAHLLDLTLLATTTLGQSLRYELVRRSALNLLVSGEVIEEMAQSEPASLQALRAALASNTAAIIGGEYRELELPLLPPEAIREQLEQGIEVYQRHLGVRPVVFGRRRFGLTPVLPQILEKLGFTGVLHATLDDGRFPDQNQSRIRWEGLDGTALEAIARVPADVGRADAFLGLPERLGNSMNLDHVATVVFAHWPGRSSTWYEDVRRVTRYTTVLGSFATATDYFQQTCMTGQQGAYRADEYHSPYLKQEVADGRPDPISRWVAYYGRRAEVEAAATFDALAAMVSGRDGIVAHAARVPAGTMAETDAREPRAPRADADLAGALQGFARAVGISAQGAGILVANPCSFGRQVCLELPEVAPPVQHATEAARRKTVVVDVPPMGFAWVGPGTDAVPPSPRPRKWGFFKQEPATDMPLVEMRERGPTASGAPAPADTVLHNEFLELNIDPHTGAIRSLFDYHSRGPRLAQQLALRLPGATGDGDDAYSIMAADEVTITSPGPVLGEAVVHGRLVDRSARRLAGFQQTVRVWRGSRIIEVHVELDVDELPGPDPWNSYYAARFAWPDEGAILHRSVNMADVPTDAMQFEALHFIDVRLKKRRTTLLTGGLPYHRRRGPRRLDTLLVVRGETARQFRLGIGVDLPNPLPAAMDFLMPRTVQAGVAPPASTSGWLFHLDARNVVATHWEPVFSNGTAEAAAAQHVSGFRVRLLETEGRRTSLGLRSFRTVRSAKKLGHPDRSPTELHVEGDRLAVDLGPYEWAEVEAAFA